MPTLLFLAPAKRAAKPQRKASGLALLAPPTPRPRWSRLAPPPTPPRPTRRRLVQVFASWPCLELRASVVRVQTISATAALAWTGRGVSVVCDDGEVLELIALGLL